MLLHEQGIYARHIHTLAFLGIGVGPLEDMHKGMHPPWVDNNSSGKLRPSTCVHCPNRNCLVYPLEDTGSLHDRIRGGW